MIVSCSQCGVKLKVDETKIKDGGSKLKCPKCSTVFTVFKPEAPAAAPAPPRPEPAPMPQRPQAPPAPAPQAMPAAPPPPPVQEKPKPKAPKWELDRRKVVVAHDGESVLSLTKSLLDEAGYETYTATEGVEAIVTIEKEKPFLVIIDVALPRIYGFEVCDRLKNSEESKDMKIILIASIYDKTRYKREPMSLYGADDYIEKHHIQDCLVDKVRRLANPQAALTQSPPVREEEFTHPPSSEEAPLRMKQAEEMRMDEIKPVPPAAQPAVSADPQLVEAARRFARIIFSDIALYNQGAINEGVRNGNLREVLAAELKEGRDLYNGRVSEEIRATMDYFDDELEKFIEKKKSTMQMGG